MNTKANADRTRSHAKLLCTAEIRGLKGLADIVRGINSGPASTSKN